MLGNILAVGLMSMGMGLSDVKDEPKQVLQTQESINLAEKTYNQLLYLAKQCIPEINEDTSPSENKTYTEAAVTGTFVQSDVNYNFTSITITWQNPHSFTNNLVEYYVTNGQNPPDNKSTSIKLDLATKTINTANTINLQEYPEDWVYYLNEQQPPQPMGPSIIGSIASGLGIIGALASEFLVGFGALFYAEGALTPFAIFALVMLGIAVSFAVVKLVLNLIRSNTGA